jgi:hypothetical protein
MEKLRETLEVKKKSYEEEVARWAPFPYTETSSFTFDSSVVVIDANKWDAYFPFLCNSLSLTTVADRDVIAEMRSGEAGQWQCCRFHAVQIGDFSHAECFTNFFLINEEESSKVRVCFFRLRSDHRSGSTPCSTKIDTHRAVLEYRTCVEGLSSLSAHCEEAQ